MYAFLKLLHLASQLCNDQFILTVKALRVLSTEVSLTVKPLISEISLFYLYSLNGLFNWMQSFRITGSQK